jgi:hypothetical protein
LSYLENKIMHLGRILADNTPSSVFAPMVAMTMLIIMLLPFAADASVKTLRGEIDLEQIYETNRDRVHTNEEYDSRSVVTPRMIFSRSTQKSNLSLSYAPSLVYSYQLEDERVDHAGSGELDVYLAERLRWDLRNTYLQSDDPYRYIGITETGDGEFELADRRGSRRYWTNRFTTSMNLAYARDSELNVGYINHVLRNSDHRYLDFTRHSPFASLSYRFNHQWSTGVSYTFSFGEYEDDGDFTTHSGDATVYYNWSPFTRLFTRGAYLQTDFEDSLDDDGYSIYTATVGLDRELSPTRNIEVETGASLIERDLGDDTEAFFLRAVLNTRMELGSWRLSAESGTDERYLRGTRRFDEEGLSRYWSAGATFSRALSSSITGTAGASYREDRYIQRPDSDLEQRYIGSATMAYDFARYYRLTLGYIYIRLDADREFDSYENHRVFIRLTAGQDFFRW